MNSTSFSVEHLGLPARDVVALKDWYLRVLGAKLRFELDPSIEYSVHINQLLKEVLPPGSDPADVTSIDESKEETS